MQKTFDVEKLRTVAKEAREFEDAMMSALSEIGVDADRAQAALICDRVRRHLKLPPFS